MDERFISNGIESDNLNMNVQEQDYKNGIKPISLTVPKNSLVAAYTNGMHRRRPFPQRDKNKSTFERNTIVTLLYNQQTKLSFLKLSL